MVEHVVSWLVASTGILGMFLLLLAFVMNLFEYCNQDSMSYQVVNVAGSGLLCFYGYMIGGYPFVVLNAVWGVAALYRLVARAL